MIETYLDLSGKGANPQTIGEIIALGKAMLEKPVELLPDVKMVLETLKESYTLIVATKGDLLDQERKLKHSSVSSFFHHIEIMTEKKEENYESLLHHLELEPEEFLMIGNSLRSDILPPLHLGCYAVHIPFHATWQYEMDVNKPEGNDRFLELERLSQVLSFLV
jgi:putative hydrolase of the HAD superfamily